MYFAVKSRFDNLNFNLIGALVLVIGFTLSGCDRPNDIAETRTNLSAGIVHEATVERIVLIFVDPTMSARFVDVAGASGELIGARRARGNVDEFELRSLSNSLFRTITELVEDRNNAIKCQYFLRVQDKALVHSVNPFGFDRSADRDPIDFERRDRLMEARNDVFELRQNVEVVASMVSSGETSAEDSGYFEAIDEYLEKKLDLITETIRSSETEEPEPIDEVLAIVNPCRSFSANERVLVISYGFDYVIEKKG